MDTIHIAICLDNSFVMPVGVMMYSVCTSNIESDIVFHVVADKVSDKSKEEIKCSVSRFSNKTIIFYDFHTSEFDKQNSISRRKNISSVTFYRLFLPIILPSDIEKVIYLDGDIIVRNSLKQLWDITLDEYAAGAVLEAVQLEERCERLGYDSDLGYFNAGMLLINLSYWRIHNILQQSLELTKKDPLKIVDQDQDILNFLLAGKILWLKPEYNLTRHLLTKKYYDGAPNKDELNKAYKNPVIIHYTCSQKPWHTFCRHPHKMIFLKYKSYSIWKDEPLIETRSIYLRIIKFFSSILRRLHLIPELPPYGIEFIPGLPEIE